MHCPPVWWWCAALSETKQRANRRPWTNRLSIVQGDLSERSSIVCVSVYVRACVYECVCVRAWSTRRRRRWCCTASIRRITRMQFTWTRGGRGGDEWMRRDLRGSTKIKNKGPVNGMRFFCSLRNRAVQNSAACVPREWLMRISSTDCAG